MSEERLIAGRYQLGQPIGRGGMGDVFRGLDTYTGQPVAIKRLHAHIVQENPSIVDRFKREGEALRQLNHPNIVKLLDAVEENNQHYLIMDYMGGGSLSDLIEREGRLSIGGALNIALDLADALTRAHRLRIVHRDIKPDNVLLSEDGIPCLTDFGVAHLGNRSRLTQTGSVIGTYAYLSPEACNGLELDERADIWSFGVMLFEMLAGRLPFEEASTGAMITAILTKPAPDLTRLRPDTPPALAALISSMLQKDRERRIASVRLVGAELEAIMRDLDAPARDMPISPRGEAGYSRFSTPPDEDDIPAMAQYERGQTHGLSLYPTVPPTMDGQPTPARPASPIPRGMVMTESGELVPVHSAKWGWLALMLGIVALAIVIIVGIVAWSVSQRQDKEKDESAAVGGPATPTPGSLIVTPVESGEYMVLVAEPEPVNTAPREVQRFVVDDLAQTLEAEVPFSRLRVRSYPAVIASADEAQAVAEANGATVVVWGSYTADSIDLQVQLGVTSAFGEMAMDQAALNQVASVRVRLTDARAQSVAPSVLSVVGVLQAAQGDIYEFMRTLAVIAEIDVTPAEVQGDTLAAYVHQYFSTYASDAAAALDASNRAIDKDPTNPLMYALRGIALARQGDRAAAERDAETAARLGPSDWVVPLYILVSLTTDHDELLGYLDRIISLHPTDWYALSSRGALYYLIGDMSHARADLQQAIALQPPSNFPYAFAALVAINGNQFEEAMGYFNIIVDKYPDPDLYSRIVGVTHGSMDMVGPLISAVVNMSLGRYEAVISAVGDGLDLLGPQINLYTMQGMAYCSLGKDAAAESAYSNAINLAPNQPAMAFVYLLRGDVRGNLGDSEGAEEDFAFARQAFGEAGAPLVDAVQSGVIECTNLFGSVTMPVVEGPPTAQPSGQPTPAPTVTPAPLVEPVAPGEQLVLVAEFEALEGISEMAGGRQRDVGRFIADDLNQVLGEGVPNSRLVIRRYPGVITSDDEAQAAAERAGAAVIVWGNYTPDLVEVRVQVGTVAHLKYMPFDPAVLQRTANVRLYLDDERRQSVAAPVLHVLAILTAADGGIFDLMGVLAMVNDLQVQGGEITGTGVAARVHRALKLYPTDPAQAAEELSTAITMDTGNPLLYFFRALVSLRLDAMEQVGIDMQTAQRLAPDSWAMPLFFASASTVDEALATYSQMIALRPDDWFGYFMRATIHYYGNEDYPAGRADLEQSIALQPPANLPYIPLIMIALREGQISQAQALARTVLTRFPDAELTNRAMAAVYGSQPDNYTGALFSAATNLLLGQYQRVLDEAAPAVAYLQEQGSIFPAGAVPHSDFSDLLLAQGMAYCNLGDYAAAEAAYDWAIELTPDFALLYALRGQARQAQNKLDAAPQDFQAAQERAPGSEFALWLAAAVQGEWNCQNLFDYRLPEQGAAAQ